MKLIAFVTIYLLQHRHRYIGHHGN